MPAPFLPLPRLNGRKKDFPLASQVHISTVSESRAKCTMARRFALKSSSLGLLSVLYCFTACSVRCPVRLFFSSMVTTGMPFRKSTTSTELLRSSGIVP